MKLILVRHGETEWVRQSRYQGATDISLNRTGILQARAVGKIVKEEKPSVIFSSELLRARQTAQEIAKQCRKELKIDHRLNELSFGKWEGFYHAVIAKKFPKAARDWYSAKWTSLPPGGESLKSLGKRINSFLSDLSKHYRKNETYVVVAHGGTIRMFLVQLLKFEPTVFWKFRIDPASLSVLNLTFLRQELALLNCQFHLNHLPKRRKKS